MFFKRIICPQAGIGWLVGTTLVVLTQTMTAPARAEDQAPLCTDAGWVKKIKTQYEGNDELKGINLKLREIKDIKEMHFGPAPKSFNQYSSANHYITNVRWCSGIAVLSNGETDTLYWHMADEKNGERHIIHYDHCSPRHNLLDTECASHREFR
jgi:hypothetical protein